LGWLKVGNESETYINSGLEILKNDPDCVESIRINAHIAYKSINNDNINEYKEYIHKIAKQIRSFPYTVDLRHLYINIIFICTYKIYDLDLAKEFCKELETRALEHHDLRAVADSKYHMEDVLCKQGDYKNAILYNQESLSIFERIGDQKYVAVCHKDMAYIMKILGNLEKAEESALMFLKLNEKIGATPYIRWAYALLGSITKDSGKLDESISYFQKALEMSQSTSELFWTNYPFVLSNIGTVYLRKGDIDQAI
jgi:tetratricopeptide (TPR) repeat protein